MIWPRWRYGSKKSHDSIDDRLACSLESINASVCIANPKVFLEKWSLTGLPNSLFSFPIYYLFIIPIPTSV